MPRALFLFNHDAAHQVAHLAPVAGALTRIRPDMETIIAYSSETIRARIENLIGADAIRRAHWIELELGPVSGMVTGLLDRFFPASRLARLRTYAKVFASCDAVISTERTCLRVQKRLPPTDRPLFVRVPHGTGDRSVTFHPDHRRFDVSLVAGSKMADQLVANGVERDRIRITGYSKFENIDLSRKPDLFGNGKPTFVYNPHFDPHLSSWYHAGPDLLRWFASDEGQKFNCIFAPHVMLFRKSTHVSPEYKLARKRPAVPAEAFRAANILVDVDGPRLFDMTYMLAADAYIGDASSQLYEFLVRPRPVFFLDPDGALRAEGKEELPFLTTGPVLGEVDALTTSLETWEEQGARYLQVQGELIERTFSLSEIPPSVRAATAIAEAIEARST